jgi:E3 ubiquitin-protein ligase CCNP1IP1
MDVMRQKNDEIGQALREKNKKLMQTQELYDKLKRKAMVGEMQHAASDAVNSNIEAATGVGTGFSDHFTQPLYEQAASHRHSQTATQRTEHMYPIANSMRGESRHLADGGWSKPPAPQCWFYYPLGLSLLTSSQADISMTPSTHRQRVGNAASLGLSTVPGLVAGTRLQTPSLGRDVRQPVGPYYAGVRTSPTFPGVGLSSGLKSGHGLVHHSGDSQGRFQLATARLPGT